MSHATSPAVHPLRLLPRPQASAPRYDPRPVSRLPPPASSVPDSQPALPAAESALWTDSPARLAPALSQDGGSALAAARQLLAFLFDAAANPEQPLTVHLPGSHDASFAWQLWHNLLAEAGELGTPPLRFRLYHTLPPVAAQDDIAALINDGHWQIAEGDVTAQTGRHAALIAHGHYSRRPATLAWNDYGEAWRLGVAMSDDGPCWRLTPRGDYPAAPIRVAIGTAQPLPALPPLFDDAAEQQLVARQQSRADRGLVALPVTLLRDLDTLTQQHPDGVLVYLADLAHDETPPQTLPEALDPALPLNIEAIRTRHAQLACEWRADHRAAVLSGVLQHGHTPWPLTRLAAQGWQADALFGDEVISLAALARSGHNPRYLARHIEAIEAQSVNAASRKTWLVALEHVWQRQRPGDEHAFAIGCLGMHFGHYGIARAAFLDALPHAANPAPALHNLALLEMLTGDAAQAADILATLESIEPEHPKTRRLRQRIDAWQSRFTPRLGWHPAQALDAETGLRLSPLMPHHARDLAWACRNIHDMALTRLPDLSSADAAAAWITSENRDRASLLLAILHPALGLVGFIGLRQEENQPAANLCLYTAPEWRGRGWMRRVLGLLSMKGKETEVWRGNGRSGRVMVVDV